MILTRASSLPGVLGFVIYVGLFNFIFTIVDSMNYLKDYISLLLVHFMSLLFPGQGVRPFLLFVLILFAAMVLLLHHLLLLLKSGFLLFNYLTSPLSNDDSRLFLVSRILTLLLLVLLVLLSPLAFDLLVQIGTQLVVNLLVFQDPFHQSLEHVHEIDLS